VLNATISSSDSDSRPLGAVQDPHDAGALRFGQHAELRSIHELCYRRSAAECRVENTGSFSSPETKIRGPCHFFIFARFLFSTFFVFYFFLILLFFIFYFFDIVE
jgi:hypothetical protein